MPDRREAGRDPVRRRGGSVSFVPSALQSVAVDATRCSGEEVTQHENLEATATSKRVQRTTGGGFEGGRPPSQFRPPSLHDCGLGQLDAHLLFGGGLPWRAVAHEDIATVERQ